MRVTLLIGLMLAVVGCSQGKGSLSVSASASIPAAATNSTSASAVNAIDGGNGVLITHIRMVVRQVEVEKGGSTSGGNSMSGGNTMAVGFPIAAHDGVSGGNTVACVTPVAGTNSMDASHCEDLGQDDDDHGEVVGGPFLIDLSGADIEGAIHWQADLPLDPGTYDEVEFKINTIAPTQAGSDAGLAAMASAHASIIAEGTLSGVPFSFSTPMAVKQEREGTFTVAEGGAFDVTLDVDPSGWFKDGSGGLLDPNDPTARGQILANIRSSIRVIHDGDHDGKDDDHEHDGGGGHGDGGGHD